MRWGHLAGGFTAVLLSLPGVAVAAPAGSTLLVSRPTGLGPVPPAFDNNSQAPGALSADGRYAVFTSDADGFAAGTNPAVGNVLLRDRLTNTTVLVSRSDGVNGAGANASSDSPAIAVAPAGVMPTAPTNKPHVLVTFNTGARNLVDHATGHIPAISAFQEIWMRDVTAGTTTLISRADGMSGAPANHQGAVGVGAIAAGPGGPVVAFFVASSNMPGGGGLLMRTVEAGKTEVVSCQNDDCSGSPAGVSARDPSIAISGSTFYIAFDSNDQAITGSAAGHHQVVEARGTAPAHPGAAAGEPSAFLKVSTQDSNSLYGNGDSSQPSVSSDGQHIAFVSSATDLTTDMPPSGTQQAFMKNLDDFSTLLVSRASGTTGPVADATVNSVALGGAPAHLRAVFDTAASNLGNSPNNFGAYVRDLSSNVTSLLGRRSGVSGVAGDFGSQTPTISSNGSAALFSSPSNNFGDGASGAYTRVLLRTLPATDVRAGLLTVISRPSGTAAFHSGSATSFISSAGAASANGRFVAFLSRSPGLSPGTIPGRDYVYVRDLLTNRTILVSRANGQAGAIANGESEGGVQVSSDGRFVVFGSAATNLSPQATTGHTQVYVRDLVKNTTTLVSRASGAGGALAGSALPLGLSADGNAVLMESSSALDPAGAGGTDHLYVRNLISSTTTLVDRDNGPTGTASNANAVEGAIDADGNRIAFITSATLAGAPADGIHHVFVRDIHAGTTTLASRADGGAGPSASGDSQGVAIDGPGDVVAFATLAQNLGATFSEEQVFIRNLKTFHTAIVSGLGSSGTQLPREASGPSLDAAGDRVSFAVDGFPSLHSPREAYVRDIPTHTTVLASRANGAAGAPAAAAGDATLDPTGNCLAFDGGVGNLGDGFASFDFDSVHLRVLRGQCPLAAPPPPSLSKLKVKKGTVSFVLSRAAKVTLRFFSLKPGHRKGKKCVVKRRHGKKCTIVKARRKLTVSGRAGVNQVRLKGKRLGPGRYRLTATPTGGKSKSLRFTVRQ